MLKPANFYPTIIDKAFENGDKKTVVDAYLQAFNYDEFSEDHLIKVFESQTYEDAIDHGLIKHINSLIERKGFGNSANLKLN